MSTPTGLTWRKSSYSQGENNCVEAAWRKSSHSKGENNCVEAAWRKSSHSKGQNNCVEAATRPAAVYVRDSKLGDAGPVLTATPAAWAGFLAALKQPATP